MASGQLQGTLNGFSQLYYNFWVEWSAIRDTDDNLSNFSATAYLQRKDDVNDSDYSANVDKSQRYISIDGKKFYYNSNIIDTRNHKKVVIASVNTKIKHDADGYKTIDFFANFPKVTDDLLGGTIQGRITFDKISVITDLKFNSISFSGISQHSVVANIKTSAVAKNWFYSLDNGASWKTWVNEQTDNLSERIDGLTEYTTYSIIFKATQVAKNKTFVSSASTVKTLPIYMSKLHIPELMVGKMGEPLEIPIIIEPENATIKKYEITSSNTSVVAVINNVPVVVGIGTAELTCTAKDGSGLISTGIVDTYYPIEKIEIIPSYVTLPKGQVFKIPYNIIPQRIYDNTVTIYSSDENVVKIQGLNALTINDGTALITVVANDGGQSQAMTIEVSGDYVWHSFAEPIEVLNTEELNKIISNMNTIGIMLRASGRTIEEIASLTAEKGIKYLGVVDFLHDIGYTLDVLNSTDIVSIYGTESFEITDKAPNKEDIWRWLQCLEDLYLILRGSFGKWQYLLCENGLPTINGKKIVVRGEKIG